MLAEEVMNSGGGDAVRESVTTPHQPILLNEVVSFLSGGAKHGLLVDGTAGAGGHLSALAEALPDMTFLGVDRDMTAISILREKLGHDNRIHLRRGSYRGIPEMIHELGISSASAALFDLGLSSMQLDDPRRGFSYRLDGPLDMRFDCEGGKRAEEMVNRLYERELADLIFQYGQEGRSRRIARAIVQNRPLRTSRELADAVASAVGGNPVKVLSRVFQAIRIAVNGEMEELDALLENLHSWTEPGARIAFITFHSMEDRKIKLLFRDDPSFAQFDPKWLVPGEDEIRRNGRARSARLRMGVRA